MKVAAVVFDFYGTLTSGRRLAGQLGYERRAQRVGAAVASPAEVPAVG